MSDIIQLLPDTIANKIAAGEVVQRPASVVKELMENAIDAKASNIQVIIKDAGKTCVQVIDDGQGMSETDARLSFERHATSKLRKAEDLFMITTMGFRGEALASIAAIAQVEMKTKKRGHELGTFIAIEGSTVKSQEAISCTEGTAISVKNLFYNVPARRNFLKSNTAEMRYIITEFQRIALAYPQIAFTLYQNDLEVYKLPTGKLSQRIVGLLGKSYKEQLASCQEETSHIKVHGYVGKPEFAKKTKGEQFFFVNKRFIKNNYLNHAVMNAYEGLLPDKAYPFYTLFIEIDPKHIDVNVHPTKTEIKFDDERTVYGTIRAAVKQALGTHNITPSLDFDTDTNFQHIRPSNIGNTPTTVTEKKYTQFKNIIPQKADVSQWEKLFDNRENTDSLHKKEINQQQVTLESAANQLNTSSSADELMQAKRVQQSFQIQNAYLVTQVKSGMMLIDQHAAHERILYEKYLAALENKKGASQQSLFPQTLTFNPANFSIITALAEEIKTLGFEFEVFGKNTIIINGIPTDVLCGTEKEVFEGLIEQYKKNKTELSLNKYENMARAMAKRAAIKHGHKLGPEEIGALIDQLFACSNPNYAPDGKAVFIIWSLDKLASFFK